MFVGGSLLGMLLESNFVSFQIAMSHQVVKDDDTGFELWIGSLEESRQITIGLPACSLYFMTHISC